MHQQGATAGRGTPSPPKPHGDRRGDPVPPIPTTEGLPDHLVPAALVSRRSFLEQVPTLVTLPAWAGIASEVRGEVLEMPRAAQVVPCTRCAECRARFCRYKVVGKHTIVTDGNAVR